MSTPPDQDPKFGRLMILCVVAALFCGVLTWFVSNHWEDCCDLSFLSSSANHEHRDEGSAKPAAAHP